MLPRNATSRGRAPKSILAVIVCQPTCLRPTALSTQVAWLQSRLRPHPRSWSELWVLFVETESRTGWVMRAEAPRHQVERSFCTARLGEASARHRRSIADNGCARTRWAQRQRPRLRRCIGSRSGNDGLPTKRCAGMARVWQAAGASVVTMSSPHAPASGDRPASDAACVGGRLAADERPG